MLIRFPRPSRGRGVRPVIAMLVMLASGAWPGAAADKVAVRLEGVASISAGASNTCALLVSAQARCWGFNEDGELGDGTTHERLLPRTVVNSTGTGALNGIISVAVGGTHSCFLLDSHRARCTGSNGSGQLGDQTTDPRSRPVTVLNSGATGPLRGVVAIAPGYLHTCALLDSGEARCWGRNDRGQLGDGTTHERHRPVLVRRPGGTPLTGVVAITAGTNHTCALLSSHQVRCWGALGQLGDGSGSDRPFAGAVLDPVGTGHLTGVKAIDAGESSTCARLETRRVVCWGDNGSGQLGGGTVHPRSRPVRVKDPSGTGPLDDVAQLSVGGGFACVRTTANRTLCWGNDDDGELGDGTTQDYRPLPAAVVTASGPKLAGVAQVSAGVGFACARFATGRARCWGDNEYGELGDGTKHDRLFPVFVGS